VATFTIKNIPDDLYERLKQNAEENRRSINSEFLVCLERALLIPKLNITATLTRIRKVRRKTSGYLLTDKELSKAKGDGRL
jgi:plasmid stability protein